MKNLILIMMLTVLNLSGCSYPIPIASNSWTLSICSGVSGFGCGANNTYVYSTKAECYEALGAAKSGDQPIAESSLKRNTIMTCHPSYSGDAGYTQ